MTTRILFWLALAGAVTAHAETPSIGVVLNDLNNPFFASILDGVYKASSERGIARSAIQVVDSQYDTDLQIQQLDRLESEGFDAIVLTAADPIELQPRIRELVSSGIHVVAVDVRAHGASTTYHTHNVHAGRYACQFLAEMIGSQGRIAIINGPGVTAVIERVAGCEYLLQKEYPNIQIVDKSLNGQGSEAGGYEAMKTLLSRYSDLDAVFAINDPSAMGADRAMREVGRNDIPIASVDGSPAIIERMSSGATNIVSTSSQNPSLMGMRAIEAILSLDEGEKVSPYNLIETELVTQQNLNGYSGW